MTINVIGENRWRHGMNKYLNGQKFTNTDGDIYFSYMNKAVTDVSEQFQSLNEIFITTANNYL